MAMTFEQLQAKFPWTTLYPAEWHQHPKGGGWVKNTAHAGATAIVEGIVSGNAQVSGNAWVCGDAWVCGNAWVSGNAQVSGDAWVSGDAQVYGDAWVYGDARVYGNAWVCGDAWCFSPLQIQGTKHFVTTCTHTHISIGCQKFTVSEWQGSYQQIGKQQGYTPDQIAEYGMLIALCADWLKAKFPAKEAIAEAKPLRDAKGRFVKR